MATNLASRITALEQKTVKPTKVFRIICKGAEPNAEEQAQIDNAEARGDFVIFRTIISPLYLIA